MQFAGNCTAWLLNWSVHRVNGLRAMSLLFSIGPAPACRKRGKSPSIPGLFGAPGGQAYGPVVSLVEAVWCAAFFKSRCSLHYFE